VGLFHAIFAKKTQNPQFAEILVDLRLVCINCHIKKQVFILLHDAAKLNAIMNLNLHLTKHAGSSLPVLKIDQRSVAHSDKEAISLRVCPLT
jgi:hypothetical protein